MEAIIIEPGAQKATLLHAKGEAPRLLKNMDTSTNNVFLGNQELFDLNGLQFSTLRPLGTIVATGEKDLYGLISSTESPVKVEKMEALSSTSSPSDQALQITLSGVPLLSSPVNVGHSTIQQTLNPSQTTTLLNNALITQIGYEVYFDFVTTNNIMSGVFPFVTLTWKDSVSGQIVKNEIWNLAVGNVGFPIKFSGEGRTKGNLLTVSVTNVDAAVSIVYNWSLTQNSRIYTKDDWKCINTPGVPTIPNGTYDTAANIICSTAPNIGAGSNASRFIAIASGAVSIWAFSTVAFDAFVTASDSSVGLSASGIWEGKVTAAGGGILTGTFYNPRSTGVLILTNNGAAAATISAVIIASETGS